MAKFSNSSSSFCPTFGSPMPTRIWSDPNAKYKFGFNGKEKDDETTVSGGDYDFGARIYNSRLGRWFSSDPLMVKYPSLTVYNYVANNPLIFTDPTGREILIHYKDDEGNLKSYSYTYNPSCTPPNNKFVVNVVNSLNAIHEGSTTGSEMLSILETNGTTNIMNSTITDMNRHLSGPVNGMRNIENGSTISWPVGYPEEYGSSNNVVLWDDLTGGITNSTGCNVRPPASKLMHELMHRYWMEVDQLIQIEYDKLTPEEQQGEKGKNLMLRREQLEKYTAYGENSENSLITDLENKVNSEMGWGTREYGEGVTPHNGAENSTYSANSPLSQDSTTTNTSGTKKTSEQRTDNQNDPCEH